MVNLGITVIRKIRQITRTEGQW
ncbi:hypothetical protein Gotri_013761, partial [Gossypium trilobum]|nr:hypothetical protein [Gossypium trilobum]